MSVKFALQTDFENTRHNEDETFQSRYVDYIAGIFIDLFNNSNVVEDFMNVDNKKNHEVPYKTKYEKIMK